MDKGLFFMTLSLTCGWLILDDFFGKKYISRLSGSLASGVNGLGAVVGQAALNTAGKVSDTATQQNTQNLIKNNKNLTPAQKKMYSDALNPFSASHGGALGG